MERIARKAVRGEAMKLLALVVSFGLSVFALAQQDNPDLANYYKQLQELKPSGGGNAGIMAKLLEIGPKSQKLVRDLLEKDALHTQNDFIHASSIMQTGMPFYEKQRIAYETLLTATLLGSKKGLEDLPRTWDLLHLTQGLGQRLGSLTKPGETASAIQKMSDTPCPDPVRNALLDIEGTKKKAAGAKNNPEIQKIVDEDQKDRMDFSPATFNEIAKRDKERLAKTLELIKGGTLVTGDDYCNAGLIMQHGHLVSDFALAHECGVIGALLGSAMGPSLCSVSYDRMLLTAGHRQRFGTQQGPMLEWQDKSGTSATERKALMVLDR